MNVVSKDDAEAEGLVHTSMKTELNSFFSQLR